MQCFGRDCYPVVFAVNAVLIMVATCKLSFKQGCIVRQPCSPGVPVAQWLEHPAGVTEVVGSISA